FVLVRILLLGSAELAGLVDPRGLRQAGQRRPAGEPPRVGRPERLDRLSPLVLDRVRGTDMDRKRRMQPDPGMVMLVVVVLEESAAELAGILNGPESFRKHRRILQCPEVSFTIRVVVADL